MTNAELAILGLIVEQSRHGYEIEKVIKERGMREWTEVGFSSIYYILSKLEEQALIRSRLEQREGRGPARKVYAVTSTGMEAWRQATIEALAVPEKRSSRFLLGFAGMPGLTPGDITGALGLYRDRLMVERERVIAGRHAAGEDPPLFLDGMFDYSVTLIEAEIEWVEQFIERMRQDSGPES